MRTNEDIVILVNTQIVISNEYEKSKINSVNISLIYLPSTELLIIFLRKTV